MKTLHLFSLNFIFISFSRNTFSGRPTKKKRLSEKPRIVENLKESRRRRTTVDQTKQEQQMNGKEEKMKIQEAPLSNQPIQENEVRFPVSNGYLTVPAGGILPFFLNTDKKQSKKGETSMH